MITPEVGLANQNVLRGLLNGLQMEQADEDPARTPYLVDILGAKVANSPSKAQDEKFISVVSLVGTVLKHDGDWRGWHKNTVAQIENCGR